MIACRCVPKLLRRLMDDIRSFACTFAELFFSAEGWPCSSRWTDALDAQSPPPPTQNTTRAYNPVLFALFFLLPPSPLAQFRFFRLLPSPNASKLPRDLLLHDQRISPSPAESAAVFRPKNRAATQIKPHPKPTTNSPAMVAMPTTARSDRIMVLGFVFSL